MEERKTEPGWVYSMGTQNEGESRLKMEAHSFFLHKITSADGTWEEERHWLSLQEDGSVEECEEAARSQCELWLFPVTSQQALGWDWEVRWSEGTGESSWICRWLNQCPSGIMGSQGKVPVQWGQQATAQAVSKAPALSLLREPPPGMFNQAERSRMRLRPSNSDSARILRSTFLQPRLAPCHLPLPPQQVRWQQQPHTQPWDPSK